jgi:membrane protease YdiL (CAAX protease family)
VTTNHSSEFEGPIVDQVEPPQAPRADEYAPVSTPAPQVIKVLDPDNPPWVQPPSLGALIAFLVWVGSVLCLLFVPLILVVPYIIYGAAKGQLDLANLASDKTFLFLSVVGVIPAHLLTILLAYFVVTSGRKYPFFKTLGTSWPPSWRTAGFSVSESWATFKSIAICSLIAIALFAVGAFITKVFPGQKTDLDLLIESSYGARVVTAFLAVFTAPLVEEVIYRGMLYPASLRFTSWLASLVSPSSNYNAIGVGVSIAIVSILFASVHVIQYINNLAVIGAIVLVSITLTIVRAFTRRLLPCLVIHLVFNGIQAVIFLISPLLNQVQEPTPKPAPAELIVRLVHYIFQHGL